MIHSEKCHFIWKNDYKVCNYTDWVKKHKRGNTCRLHVNSSRHDTVFKLEYFYDESITQNTYIWTLSVWTCIWYPKTPEILSNKNTCHQYMRVADVIVWTEQLKYHTKLNGTHDFFFVIFRSHNYVIHKILTPYGTFENENKSSCCDINLWNNCAAVWFEAFELR